ncbi:MAG: sensor histidine kinase KdpD, partial [Polyangiaceae bacterium]|nr:sensor histidine kinase KdpD [Polyangiaceae bacterium]
MEPSTARPDPDALLRRVNAEEERARRAKLKLYFGFAPGVGKTYAMLEVAQRLRAEGVDVVVGCVETHGRAETTALALGLEVVPRRIVPYRGTTLEELDLEAALARRPAVLLLDELAHTNAPGLRHKKRWQDLLDLLAAGIEVHTTLNVQHVESLNDVIAQVTGVRVRETVPDHILDRADEIELVDLPPEELLLRLREGKVYVPEQAARATQNFFQRGKLLALRELALRRTAERVEADVRAYREEHSVLAIWASAERILVCVSPSPTSARLVRGAYRMASGLRAHWVAAYVDVLGTPLAGRADRERLEAHLSLAESLGAEIVRLAGSKVSAALLEYAREHHVTRLVIGKPTHPRLRDRLRGSLLDEVVRGSGDIDVHVISGDEPVTPARAAARPPRAPLRGASYASAVALVAAATALGVAARSVFADADTAMIYLFGITVAGAWLGRGPSLVAAALSVAAFDFFFVPPFHTFAVSDVGHLLTFAVMFAVGVATSAIAARLRRQERAATSREARTGALYALSRELGAAVDADGVALAAGHHAAAAFGGGAAVLLLEEGGELRTVAPRGHTVLGPDELAVARWALEHGEPAGAGTDTLPGARIRCLPLVSGGVPLGVLALSAPEHGALAPADRDFVEAFLRQVCLALERARLA